ncbi:MAG: hypothetical protein KGH85_02995 [Thaumarchaeota archaeon]|nr:hypothetical protein [Nitrososphaerota archaeon]
MMENEDLVVKLSEMQNIPCTLYVEEKLYSIRQISITKSTIPVRKPTTRGGVYFTDTMAYKIRAIIPDMSISAEIPKLMLGPNTDFKPILIKTRLTVDDTTHHITLITHLTNAVNTKEHVELNLIVDKVDVT